LAFVINNLFLVQEGLQRLATVTGPSLSPEEAARNEKLQTKVRNATEGAERVKDLVTKLRTFSRLDEGQFKTVNIHESIESVLLVPRQKTDGRIKVEPNFSGPDTLSCFAGELNQVLMNVIANAIDSIDGPGKVTLTTTEDQGNFVIVVRDTGRGIPP